MRFLKDSDPDLEPGPDPKLFTNRIRIRNFSEAGSGSEINHSGSTALILTHGKYKKSKSSKLRRL